MKSWDLGRKEEQAAKTSIRGFDGCFDIEEEKTADAIETSILRKFQTCS